MSASTRSIWATVKCAPASAATRRTSRTRCSPRRRLDQRELLQRAQPPGDEAVPLGQLGRPLEQRRRAPGARRAAGRGPPAPRTRPRAAGRAAARGRRGQPACLVDPVAGPARRARRPRPARRAPPGSGSPVARACATSAVGGLRVARGERGPDEHEQQLDPPCRRRAELVEPAQQPVPERPGRCRAFPAWARTVTSTSSASAATAEPGAARDRARSAVSSALASAPRARARRALSVVSAAAAVPVSGAVGELGRQLAPRPRAGPGAPAATATSARAGQLGPLRRQQLGEHRLAGQRVPEPEPLAVHRDELGVDRPTQRPRPRSRRRRRRRRAAAPSRTAGPARPRRRAPAARPRRAPQAGCAATRRSWRVPTGWVPLGPPPAVLRGPSAPDVTEPGQQLLDQERQPVAVLGDEGRHGTVDPRRRTGRRAPSAQSPSKGERGAGPCDPPAPQPVQQVRDARTAGRPGGGQAQHPLGARGCRRGSRPRPASPGPPSAGPPARAGTRRCRRAPGAAGPPPRRRARGSRRRRRSSLPRAPVRHEPGQLGAEPGQLGRVRRPLPSARDQQGLAQRAERERGPRRDRAARQDEKRRDRRRAPPPPGPAATCRRRPRRPVRRPRLGRRLRRRRARRGPPARRRGRRPPDTAHRPRGAVWLT